MSAGRRILVSMFINDSWLHMLIRYLLLTVVTILMPLVCFGSESAMDMGQMPMPSIVKQPSVRLEVQKVEDGADSKLVTIRLTDTTSNKPLTLDELVTMHTQKIHLLIIDESLQDYSHIHPKPTTPGVYVFNWNPKTLNIRTAASGQDEYVGAWLVNNQPNKIIPATSTSLSAQLANLNFKMAFAGSAVKIGQESVGTISVINAKGDPFTGLEPVMGSYAHIVGFSKDLQHVMHIHPLGMEPANSSERGGPQLKFMLQPEFSGFCKLFAQVRVNGKDLFVPFSIMIAQ